MAEIGAPGGSRGKMHKLRWHECSPDFRERLPVGSEEMPVAGAGRPAWKSLSFPDVPEPQAAESPFSEASAKGKRGAAWNRSDGELSAAGLPLRLLAVRALALKVEPAETGVLYPPPA